MPDLSQLKPGAAAAVTKFLAAFPAAVITSAVRTVQEQAEKMAANVIKDWCWIEETYAPSRPRDACQTWCDENITSETTVETIANGLWAVLSSFDPSQLHHLSWHLEGRAFDVLPTNDEGAVICLRNIAADHIAAGGHAELLLHEGSLQRWHLQIDDLPTTEENA